MNFVLRPWQLLLLILAGWINRDQQDAIEYLLTENQVLREKLGKGRILLNDDQRRRLAVKGKGLSNCFSVISLRACREGLLHLFFPAGQVEVLPAG